jgi:hypothetical protein
VTRRAPIPFAVLCAVLCTAAAAATAAQALGGNTPTSTATPLNEFTWLRAVREHGPGETDKALFDARGWPQEALRKTALRALSGASPRLHQQALTLHMDVAIAEHALAVRTPGSSGSLVFHDGRLVGQVGTSFHWTIARQIAARLALLPGGREIARDWYRATSSLQQEWVDGGLLRVHLEAGLGLLPDDPVLLLHEGTLYQMFADGRVQSSVREAGRGTMLAVDGPARELERAERRLRRALELDPTLVEARIRLAHVLSGRGLHDEAFALVEPALRETLPPFFEYYAATVLGRSAERIGRVEAARAAFQRALGLFPHAQAPRIGLSRLAIMTGRPAEGIDTLLEAAGPLSPIADDPWWMYFTQHEPRAKVRLEAWAKNVS